MPKPMQKRRYGTTLVGVVILALAAVIIFMTIAVPRMQENKIFNQGMDRLLNGEQERMLVSDPLLQTGSALLDRGAEVLLSQEQIRLLRDKLQAVMAGGFRNVENKKKTEGAWDLKWQIRTKDGTVTDMYFTESTLYFYADATAFVFEPKDFGAYDALYALLRDVLTA